MFWGCKVVSDTRKGEWVSRKSKLVLNHKSQLANKELDLLVRCSFLNMCRSVNLFSHAE